MFCCGTLATQRAVAIRDDTRNSDVPIAPSPIPTHRKLRKQLPPADVQYAAKELDITLQAWTVSVLSRGGLIAVTRWTAAHPSLTEPRWLKGLYDVRTYLLAFADATDAAATKQGPQHSSSHVDD